MVQHDDQQHHPDSAQQSADEKTEAVERQIKALDAMLTGALPLAPFSFERLLAAPRALRFEPGPLGVAAPVPDWDDFVPERPSGPRRLLRRSRYKQQVAAAWARFGDARSDHVEQQAQRQRALAVAKARHDQEVTEEHARMARQNAYIASRQTAFAAGDAQAVEWYVGQVLAASRYPDVFPREHRVVYRPENRDVVVEFELPPRRIVPTVRGFRYVKSRDAIEPVPRPEREIRQRYQHLIACVALRTLHEIFSATPPEVVEAIIFNGRAGAVDRATGKPVRPHLLSVPVERAAFGDLVLAAVDPVACLTHLNALASPDPFDLVSIQPFVAFDHLGGGAGPDSRSSLLELPPAEFEHLVRRLFVAMGAEGWTRIPSRDGGVDAIASSKNVFFGGACLIQARRWTGLVGPESVHALAGAMADHKASAGVLATTSWFGRTSEQFATHNRITLINGIALSRLIKEHLDKDVVPGTAPPRTR